MRWGISLHTTKYNKVTTEEFSKQSFGAGDKARYKDGIYVVATVDFDEQLIGLLLNISGGEPDDVSWVRCENVDYISGVAGF